MLNTFKSKIGETEYSFYRTTNLKDEIVYFIMYTSEGQRNSIKVTKDGGECCFIPSEIQRERRKDMDDLIYLVKRNEGIV